MSQPLRDKPDLEDAGDTDEVYMRGYELAAWGLRNGECDESDAVDWVLGHSYEARLPRGSSGRLNPTRHHVKQGAKAAVENYDPTFFRTVFDPEPLHALAERVSGSGVAHERYLLGAIALCHRYQTLTPVITGPLLAEVVGVNHQAAGRALSEWSNTLGGGFFSGVAYSGQRGHGRVWTVDPGWLPVPKAKHKPGCSRSGGRCKCSSDGWRETVDLSFAAVNDRSTKTRHTDVEFATWLETLERRTPLHVEDVAKHLGVTRAAATKLLRSQQGGLLDEFTYPGGLERKRLSDGKFVTTRSGEKWFVGEP